VLTLKRKERVHGSGWPLDFQKSGKEYIRSHDDEPGAAAV